MSESMSASGSVDTTDALIEHRREVADLRHRIRNRRMQVVGLFGVPLLFALVALLWAGLGLFVWLGRDIPGEVNGTFAGILAALLALFIALANLEFNGDLEFWEDRKTPVSDLKLDLELAEERRILEARRLTPSTVDRRASYKERIPGEVVRLRKESRYYRRVHLFLQWVVFVGSAGVSAITAWYDPPQPGKGVLIVLGFTITVITAVVGYFKPRERAFNLQQTADSMEQHVIAIDLGISPYGRDDEQNLEGFATTVEALRADQRMREQQLEQSHQGQPEVI
ncbi:SLATT domain-containing protein [Kitasatospora sp. NBC_00039]|uniref:SLATT domain-containing protein n=1 Tax=Kitasatospora sp. NBC_00039 TaxID=2903565 RepID=UPI00324411F3